MRFVIDTNANTLHVEDPASGTAEYGLYTPEAFALLSEEWVRLGWSLKYAYRFSWLGRPIIQLPEDLLRIQEVIWAVKPDVIIETGVAHGGSLVFYAGLCRLLGKGRVIGVDIEIRPHNRAAIAEHPLAPGITLVEGSSIDPAVVAGVHALVKPGECGFVLLDSNHSKAHVLAELEAYHSLVGPGSYIVATDGIMRHVADRPRGQSAWAWDNPAAAAAEFAAAHPEFVLECPPRAFNESPLTGEVTHWPDAWLRRVR